MASRPTPAAKTRATEGQPVTWHVHHARLLLRSLPERFAQDLDADGGGCRRFGEGLVRYTTAGGRFGDTREVEIENATFTQAQFDELVTDLQAHAPDWNREQAGFTAYGPNRKSIYVAITPITKPRRMR